MDLAQNETIWHSEVTYYHYTQMIGAALNLIGIVANVMIVSTILSSKSLQTRSYLLLLNWSIFDILFKISTDMFLHSLLEQFPVKKEMLCISSNFDMIFLFAEIIFMLALISNWALKTYRMNDLMVFFIFYGIIVFCLVIVFALCMYDIVSHLVHALAAFSYIVLLIVVIAKGVNRLRKAMSDPLSPDTVKRLNVASIYTYTMLILFLSVLTVYKYKIESLIDFIAFVAILIPVFIHLYLTKADEVYKACFLDLIFCRRHVERPIENVNTHNAF